MFATSLYSDDINDQLDLNQQVLEKAYDYVSKDIENTDMVESIYLERYMISVFKLSQLTSGISNITDESQIYSDIQRLNRISIELSKLLGEYDIEFNYKSIGTLSKIQSYYQETIYKLHVISPYIPRLLFDNKDKTAYYVNYVDKVTNQIQENVNEMISIKHQLNQGQSSPLPFSPETPQQLSFALENQLNSSLINMIQSDSQSSDLGIPYSSMATPANTDLFNQSFGSSPANIPSPNASPLQMMNYIPMF